MKKTFLLLPLIFLLNSCAESVAYLGTSVGGVASNGKIFETSLNSAVSYGIKKQTGKSPLGHALAYSEKRHTEKNKESCLSFKNKKNAQVCETTYKQINSTQTKIKKKKKFNIPRENLTSYTQHTLNKNFKIKYLD